MCVCVCVCLCVCVDSGAQTHVCVYIGMCYVCLSDSLCVCLYAFHKRLTSDESNMPASQL